VYEVLSIKLFDVSDGIIRCTHIQIDSIATSACSSCRISSVMATSFTSSALASPSGGGDNGSLSLQLLHQLIENLNFASSCMALF
jgi:hypothetical protein